jgi:cation:H+ antiporter
MITNLLLLLVGLVVLILGGDFLVNGASKIALRLSISPMVIGLTVVAFGTSAPELLISLKSAINNSPDIAVGNVVGSNICNLALVLGITSLINPIKIQTNTIWIDWPIAMFSSLLFYLLSMNFLLTRPEGILLVVLLVLYIWFLLRKSRKDKNLLPEIDAQISLKEKNKKHILQEILLLVIGCAGLYFGADWFVEGAKNMASNLGVSERVIGITVVAVGTSLPELATSVMAAIKKKTDLALGNLMGSNIFNVLSIMGITSIVQNIRISEQILQTDIIWMLAITLLVFPIMLTRKEIERFEGAFLFIVYLIYTYNVVA